MTRQPEVSYLQGYPTYGPDGSLEGLFSISYHDGTCVMNGKSGILLMYIAQK